MRERRGKSQERLIPKKIPLRTGPGQCCVPRWDVSKDEAGQRRLGKGFVQESVSGQLGLGVLLCPGLPWAPSLLQVLIFLVGAGCETEQCSGNTGVGNVAHASVKC